MSTWQEFEFVCCNYLNCRYGDFARFENKGGSDSTVADIKATLNNGDSFYIEVKEPLAQSGQFVLLADKTNSVFTFSPGNKSEITSEVSLIIDHMNNDFDRYSNAGTAGQRIDIDQEVFGRWIMNSYISKGVRYFITKGRDFIIFPVEKFTDYFDIACVYRTKKSGSSEPAAKDYQNIIKIISNKCPHAEIHVDNSTGKSRLYVYNADNLSGKSYSIGNYTYLLKAVRKNILEIRRLSNTYNMNVIFNISLKKAQNAEDLNTFISDIR
ncbi:MAG: hypothetical protein E7488_01780 [Ruminococcaceae bacterium]|nr:hypothetical protein [Oscillospiraceae bacterium]